MADSSLIKLETKVDKLADKLDGVADQLETLAIMTAKGFEQVDKRFEQVDKRFEQVDKRFDDIDKRFDENDKQHETMVATMYHLHKESMGELALLRRDFNTLNTKFNALVKQIDEDDEAMINDAEKIHHDICNLEKRIIRLEKLQQS